MHRRDKIASAFYKAKADFEEVVRQRFRPRGASAFRSILERFPLQVSRSSDRQLPYRKEQLGPEAFAVYLRAYKLSRLLDNANYQQAYKKSLHGPSRGRYRNNPGHIRTLPKNVMDKTYTERVKLRGYNGPVTVFSAHGADAGKVLRKLHPEMTKEEHLGLARKYRKRYYAMQTLHSRLLDRAARQTWGRAWRTSDYRVSGIGSDEFSASMKKRLRDANTLLNAYSRAYRAHEYAAGRRNVN